MSTLPSSSNHAHLSTARPLFGSATVALPILALLCGAPNLVSCQSTAPTVSTSAGAVAPAGGADACDLTLHEDFGVAHPDQIVLFQPCAIAGPIADEHGVMVPSQRLSDGTIAIRTDLPMNARRAWHVVPGAATAPTKSISITPRGDTDEIDNGIVAIRIPHASSSTTQTPSPIQGLRYRDGTWTAVGPNWMERPALGMTVEKLEDGPLIVRYKVTYKYDRAPLNNEGKLVLAAGEGTYSSTIEVQAGQPSILFEEHSGVEIGWGVNTYEGLTPNHARYRGRDAHSVELGHFSNGKKYAFPDSYYQDAEVDVDYRPERHDRGSLTAYPFLLAWDPWAIDSGHYWQMFDDGPGANDNLLGLFSGPASRLIGPGESGVSFDATTNAEGRKSAGIHIRFQRRRDDAKCFVDMRFGWGLFLGKRSKDLQPATALVQEITRQWNLHAGSTRRRWATC